MSNQYRKFDVVVVGAGFAGLYMLYRLRKQGFSALVLERADGVGGTWYWNRYPGARCDVESLEYSYSFSEELQQEWEWSERYSSQPEILEYANHVADRFHLRDGIEFETEVRSAKFDETSNTWHVETSRNETLVCQSLVMATGCLSSTNHPHMVGIDDFRGDIYHTGQWPHEPVDLQDKRIGIIGTGSSAIQAIPHLAEAASELVVFQRTPNFSVPARNRPSDPEEVKHVKSDYPQFREENRLAIAAIRGTLGANDQSVLGASEEERESEFQKRWSHGGFAFMGAFNDLSLSKDANNIAAEFVRDRIREVVHDPAVAELLAPDSTLGCKRLCLDTEYYETFNQPHVSLIDINRDPIQKLTAEGVQTASSEFEFDVVIFATGFDAMTGTLLRVDIRGRDGQSLNEKWEEGPKTYLGLTTANFPNLFMISGPGSPSVLTNMIVSIEQHVDWVADCLTYMREHGHNCIDADRQAEEEWVAYVNAIADMTLYPTCNSWYLGANIPGKPRVFMPHVGFPNYVERCNDVVNNDYQGFHLT